LADVNAYDLASNKEKRLPATAPFQVKGNIERSYTEVMNGSLVPPGSRFFPIGGTFYRTHVRRRANIRLEVKADEGKNTAQATGAVGPATANQRVLVDVLFPDGKSRRSVETKTRAAGQFTARLNLLDDHGKVQSGVYRVQAFIFAASELADAESNVVQLVR